MRASDRKVKAWFPGHASSDKIYIKVSTECMNVNVIVSL